MPSNSLEDHPRGCGEHPPCLSRATTASGSSPRLRGALRAVLNGIRSWRIIPADAGSTTVLVAVLAVLGDHPRGCGEHTNAELQHSSKDGSSPRMRGARYHDGNREIVTRIIPADAGSTPMRPEPRTPEKDHPRGCGEHNPLWLCLSYGPGSSPRMRGALKSWLRLRLSRGIIPADAGSTGRLYPGEREPQDHPRGCGEHQNGNVKIRVRKGSSPRMRGAHHDSDIIILTHRIIPADAGSTSIFGSWPGRRRDHPRGCGEHDAGRGHQFRRQGSSPRMRGALSSASESMTSWQDHPRGCGEH